MKEELVQPVQLGLERLLEDNYLIRFAARESA